MTYDIIGKANMFLITICEQRANLQRNIPIAGVVKKYPNQNTSTLCV